MLGTNIEDPYGRWTKAAATDTIDLLNIHRHIFALRSAGGFVAYEYQDGPMPDLSAINEAFLTEFILYLVRNNLSSLLGLQVRLEGVPESMFELILNQGTIMLDKAAVHGCLLLGKLGGYSSSRMESHARVLLTKRTQRRLLETIKRSTPASLSRNLPASLTSRRLF